MFLTLAQADALNIIAAVLLQKWNSKTGEIKRFYFSRTTQLNDGFDAALGFYCFLARGYTVWTHTQEPEHIQGYIPRELDPDEEACSLRLSQYFDTMEKKMILPVHSEKNR